MTASGDFDGFPREGLEFLRELPTRDKAWFHANMASYASGVAEPAKAFASTLGELLQETISPAIVAQPKVNGSISPINRDLRFSADKTPYKDHVLFRWWEGPQKKSAPTLFVRLSGEDVGFASGAMFASVDRWRERVDAEATGAQLAGAIELLGGGKSLDVAGAELKRVPAPYAADHPRGDLLRHKLLQVRWLELMPESVSSPAFADWCLVRLQDAADIHRWLVDNL